MPAYLVLVVLLSCGGSALAYEQPEYHVVRKYEDFELRRYASYVVAETIVSGEFDEVGNEAFRILAGYISGKNRKQSKIPMTAPVSQSSVETSGEKIAMTIPVVQTPNEKTQGAYIFSFIMPSKYTLDTLPQPEDSRIRFRQVSARLLAARRYSGTWSEKRYKDNEARLLEAVNAVGLSVVGEPIFARYNSPFTLWFLRRNEVLVEVAAEHDTQSDTAVDAYQQKR